MELTIGDVRVVFEDIGEGLSGDYNEDDPGDVALLRFTVYRLDQDWEQVEDASYCTAIPVDTDPAVIANYLARIMVEVYKPVMAGQSVKRACEDMSWLGTPA